MAAQRGQRCRPRCGPGPRRLQLSWATPRPPQPPSSTRAASHPEAIPTPPGRAGSCLPLRRTPPPPRPARSCARRGAAGRGRGGPRQGTCPCCPRCCGCRSAGSGCRGWGWVGVEAREDARGCKGAGCWIHWRAHRHAGGGTRGACGAAHVAPALSHFHPPLHPYIPNTHRCNPYIPNTHTHLDGAVLQHMYLCPLPVVLVLHSELGVGELVQHLRHACRGRVGGRWAVCVGEYRVAWCVHRERRGGRGRGRLPLPPPPPPVQQPPRRPAIPARARGGLGQHGLDGHTRLEVHMGWQVGDWVRQQRGHQLIKGRALTVHLWAGAGGRGGGEEGSEPGREVSGPSGSAARAPAYIAAAGACKQARPALATLAPTCFTI